MPAHPDIHVLDGPVFYFQECNHVRQTWRNLLTSENKMRMGRVPKDELEQTAITKKRYMQNKCQNDQIDLQVGMQ